LLKRVFLQTKYDVETLSLARVLANPRNPSVLGHGAANSPEESNKKDEKSHDKEEVEHKLVVGSPKVPRADKIIHHLQI
jgi:hypothetical protein